MFSLCKETIRISKTSILSCRKKLFDVSRNAIHRTYYTHTLVSYTWRTRLRPDLKENKHWELDKGTEEYKQSVKENLYWYKDVDTDEFFNTVSNDLVNGGTIRPGILNVLLYKAQKAEHFNVLMQTISWLQAKFNYDMGSDVCGMLCKAAYRARTPESAIKIIESPLVRMWPSEKNVSQLVAYFIEEAEKIVFKAPLVHDYNEKAASEDPTIESLTQRFTVIEDFINNENYEIKKDSNLSYFLARFYALTGNYDKMVENFKYLRDKKAENTLILTYYISRNDFDKARKFIDEVPKDKMSRSFISLAVSVHLELGEHDKATSLISSLDIANKSILQTHFGRKDRFLKVVNILESNPNIVKTQNYEKYKEIVSKYLDEHGISDEAEETKEQEAEASTETETEATTEETAENKE